MADGTPARIDRAALERIIQRAAELQTSERDIGDSLTPDEVLALGKEVGIPGRYLQQALLEERTRLVQVAPAGVLERAVGPAEISAQRVVRGDPEDVELSLIRWLEEWELFCVQRQQPGRISWEPVGGIQATIRRATAAAGGTKRPMMLARAETISATVVALEPGFTHVTLAATARKARTESIAGGAALATAGIAVSGVLLVLGSFVVPALFPVPLGLGLGYVTLKRYGPIVARIQLGLERALDHLEQAPSRASRLPPGRPPGLLELLADEVRRVVRERSSHG